MSSSTATNIVVLPCLLRIGDDRARVKLKRKHTTLGRLGTPTEGQSERITIAFTVALKEE